MTPVPPQALRLQSPVPKIGGAFCEQAPSQAIVPVPPHSLRLQSWPNVGEATHWCTAALQMPLAHWQLSMQAVQLAKFGLVGLAGAWQLPSQTIVPVLL